jgi:AraC-like DNA-binding protein
VLLLGLAMRLAKSYFVFIPQKYPHWGVVAGGAGLWIIGPAFYLYTLHAINSERKASIRYLIHFTPAALILITRITDFVYYVGLAHILVYFCISVLTFIKNTSNVARKHFQVFASSVGLILLSFTFQAMGGGIESYTVGTGIAITTLYVVNFFIAKESDFFVSPVKKTKDVNKSLSLEILKDVNSIFSEGKVYRKKGLTIADVAKQISQPAYLISLSINQGHGIRFNEFVNRYRVLEAMERLKSANDKIEVIGKDVGFSSTSSLYEAFKKETNLTPQGYRSQSLSSSGRTIGQPPEGA